MTTTEAGTFSVNAEARTVRGLLLPWDEESRLSGSQTEPISFARGTIGLPGDFSALNANRSHDRFDPVARFTSLEDTEAGIVAEFAIAATPEGDEFLQQSANGTFRKLSAELGRIVRDGKKGISAVLTGAAFVTEGAFASAGLFAISEELEPDAPAVDDGPKTTSEKFTDEFTDEAGDTHKRTTTTTTTVDGNKTTIVEKIVIEEPDTPVEEEENTVAEAVAPDKIAPEKKDTLNGVFNLIANGQRGDDTALMALSDIKVSGTGALPKAGVIQPAWLGELYGKRSYIRKYFPLVRQGTIAAMEEKGFHITGTEDLVQAWAGNKVELPTGSGATELTTSILQRWGYAADIAQEFFLIPGNEEVISAFLNKIVNSYEKISDIWVRDQLAVLGNAGNIAADVYPTEYPSALGQLIQGIEALEDAGHSPTFAIANAAAWKELLYTPHEQIPEFIKFGFGVKGEGTADGIRVVKGALAGDDLTANSVMVGSSAGAHVNELPGASPVQLSALDIARGGVDKAVIGITQWMADDPTAFVAVTPDVTP